MSTVFRLGKRSLPVMENEDSQESNDVQILRVKKPRISGNEGREGGVVRMYNVLNFMENSPRLKRFIKAVLSTFGIQYGTDDNGEAVAESAARDSVLDQEENDLPVSQSTLSFKDNEAFSISALTRTYEKVGQNSSRFVTLRQTQSTHQALTASSYNRHGKPIFEPKYTPTNPAKCTSEHERLTRGAKLTNGNSKAAYSFPASGDFVLPSDSHEDPCSSTEIEEPSIDDIQFLFNEHKTQQRNNCDAALDKRCLNGSVAKTPACVFNGLNFTADSYITESEQEFADTRLSHWQNKFFAKAPHSLKSERYSPFTRSKTLPRKMNSTTEESVRIKEKEQYQELLHRCSSEQWNRHLKPKFRRNASVQVNFNELNLASKHFSSSYFSQIRKQSDLYTREHSKNSSSVSSDLKDGLSDIEEPATVDGMPKACRSKSYSCPFSQQDRPPFSSSPDMKNSLSIFSPHPSSGFRNANASKETWSPKTMMNGSSNNRNRSGKSWTNSKYARLHKKETLPESSKTLPRSVAVRAEAEPCDKSRSQSFPRNYVQKSKLELSAEHSASYDSLNSYKERPLISDTKKQGYAARLTAVSQIPRFPFTRDKSVKSVDSLTKTDPFESKQTLSKSASSSLSSPTWIYEWKRVMDEELKERSKILADREEEVNKYRKLQADKHNKFMQLLQKDENEVTEVICLDEKPDLPSLTPEVEEIIDQALSPHSPSQVMSTISNFTILWKDIDTLSGSNWLNDEIINCYMLLIQERSRLENYPSVYAFTSFFYPKLKSQGYPAVKRWTRKVDIFEFDLLFVPLHLGVHWCLAVIDFKAKKIQYYDSMDANENCLLVLQNYLKLEYSDKKQGIFDIAEWSLDKMKDIPPQLNGSDCGMFTLKYAEYISRGAKINFTQQNMQYFRRKMVYEIIAGILI